MTIHDGASLRALYATLSARRRPEDVAEMIGEVLGDALTRTETRVLDRARRSSLRRTAWGYSSMAQEFAKPVGLTRQVATACALFQDAHPLAASLADDPAAVEAFIAELNGLVGKTASGSSFQHDRLPAKLRKARGIAWSRRGYNKRFRVLCRMETRLARLVRERRKQEFVVIGKTGLATKLGWDDFSRDVDSACFIAYLTARAARRSEFTVEPQQRAFDEIAGMLFARCTASPTTHWWAIAHVYPHQDVFARLTEREVGALLGRWFGVLEDVAALLEEAWAQLETTGCPDRSRMIVWRGMDSSTWNGTASAWNKARDNWMGLLHALGLEAMLDQTCPGKVMRLMAADVACWHEHARSGVDPNTLVWADLPAPWEVLRGAAVCTREMVEASCRRHGVDAERSGWTAPRARTRVATFRPTPELVHGVAVGSPYLAERLRKAGWFAGPSKWKVPEDAA